MPWGQSVSTGLLELRFEGDSTAFTYWVKASDTIILSKAWIKGSFKSNPDQWILANGFQSWSESRYLQAHHRQKPPSVLIRLFARYYGDFHFFSYQKFRNWQHSWSFTIVPLPGDSAELLASLNEDVAYTCILWHHPSGRFLAVRDCAGKRIGSEPWPLFSIFHARGPHHNLYDRWASLYSLEQAWRPPDTLRGWTSWYYHYQHISQAIFLSNLKAYCSLPVQIMQLDDGYQKAVGLWTQHNFKFPVGLKALADSVHHCGKKAGIWVAPFVVDRRSGIPHHHPEWLVKNDKGRPLRVGYNPTWKGWYFALDLYQAQVRDYLRGCLDTLLRHWGYDFLKADFLFAAGLVARPDLNKTRAETMADALRWLRQVTEGRLLLLCGVPLGPAFKKADFCRIGNDIHLRWDMCGLRWLRAPERPSTILSMLNTVVRSPLSGRFFGNDPDVYILRSEHNHLTPWQRRLLTLVNHTFGMLLLTSDNPDLYEDSVRTHYHQWLGYRGAPVVAVPAGPDIFRVIPAPSLPLSNTPPLFIELRKRPRHR
ncbi:MAG: alpha-galactosidase [Flavobacteriales bacterium]|nr:alpha-galactosidase [Flavobacteriales bacterium]MCX7767831.1 alpha-galactosidase [Flavobacteriales bacterium]MDW8410905.1 alpha-galactosidase [Flavobacteriales bacterium]